MAQKSIEKAESYDLLSRIGKKVLRPGGKKLSLQMLHLLDISEADTVIEFAPGIGLTATYTLQKHPKQYIGLDKDARNIKNLRQKFNNPQVSFLLTDVAKPVLPSNYASKVYGEAMLTMYADHKKLEIIAEAKRILQTGGLYAIHELAIEKQNLSDKALAALNKELAQVSHVNARPLGITEWQQLLQQEGFKIVALQTSEMLLLEPKRLLADEGILNLIKIFFRIICNQQIRKRVIALKKAFRKHRKHLKALVIIAQKLD